MYVSSLTGYLTPPLSTRDFSSSSIKDHNQVYENLLSLYLVRLDRIRFTPPTIFLLPIEYLGFSSLSNSRWVLASAGEQRRRESCRRKGKERETSGRKRPRDQCNVLHQRGSEDLVV